MEPNPYESPREAEQPSADSAYELIDSDSLPSLYRDRSFWGMTSTQFLGAFNDNLFKQMMLLLAVPVAGSAVKEDSQGLATAVFSLPFILFSGFAGFLADRYSKRRSIVLCKIAEIVVMLLGVIAFASFGFSGYYGLLVVLFLMGTQSAFFGPPKYGILPEMLRESDLPRANGVILMTTFLAIIFGTAIAGAVVKLFGGDAGVSRMWMAALICVGIAVVGTLTSLLIRPLPPAQPKLQFRASALAVPRETRQMVSQDTPLLLAVMASCLFWMVAGIAIQVVNAFGLQQLGKDEAMTSLLTAVIAIGIAAGAVIAGRLSHGRADGRIVKIGAWGVVLCLVALALVRPDGQHLLGYVGSMFALVLLGASAGFFSIPVQVFIQSRPPAGLKGRMIALMNQANFLAIFFAGLIYHLFTRITEAAGWPQCVMFGMMAVLMIPALFYNLNAGETTVLDDEESKAKP